MGTHRSPAHARRAPLKPPGARPRADSSASGHAGAPNRRPAGGCASQGGRGAAADAEHVAAVTAGNTASVAPYVAASTALRRLRGLISLAAPGSR